MAILRSDKKINIAFLHRNMQYHHEELNTQLAIKNNRFISYSQLKRIFQQIDYTAFNEINTQYFGFSISNEENQWYAIDGKELRGTIEKQLGKKRGENIVTRVNHEDHTTSVIGYYDGKKESERIVTENYVESQEKLIGKYTFDALHNSSKFLQKIDQKGGVYLVPINDNQPLLLQDCDDLLKYELADFAIKTEEKGHGRKDIREAVGFDIYPSLFDNRWKKTGISSLIVMHRQRTISKSKKTTNEVTYYISNLVLNENSFQELFRSIRNHWQVETNHYIRDVQFGEDQLIIGNRNESRLLASFISLTLNIFKKESNISILREKLVRDNHFKLVKQFLSDNRC